MSLQSETTVAALVPCGLITSGRYVPLKNVKLLVDVIIGGGLEELSLNDIMDECHYPGEGGEGEGIC